MADAAEEQAAHGDVDEGLGDIEPGLVIAHQAAPADLPAEGPLDHPPAGEELEA